MVSFERLSGPFGVRAVNVDIARDMGDDLVQTLAQQLFSNRIVIVPNQGLSNDQYVQFGKMWGRPIQVFKKDARVDSHPEMVRQANSESTPEYMRNLASHWHSDSSYEAEPSSVTMIYGVESPEDGGETLFVDLIAAYAALDSETKARVKDIKVRHRAGAGKMMADETIIRQETLTPEQKATFEALPAVDHPLVMKHPVSGALGLYGFAGSASEIVGMPASDAERLLTKLKEHAVREQFRQSYKLMPGDILLWDNYGVMHRATPIEYSDAPGRRRLNYRISVRGYPAGLGSVH